MASDNRTRRARYMLVGIGALGAALVATGALTVYSLLDDSSPTAVPHAAKPSTLPGPAPSTPSLMTPEKGQKVTLAPPGGQRQGVSTGFPRSALGSVSAAVYFWEEYAFLDDSKARQQLTTVISPDAVAYADALVSDVRTLRESVGLPPSGGTPAGITFSTAVKAVRVRSLDTTGDVVDVWMTYDRYATKADGKPDTSPLKDQSDDLILKWHDGMWQLTNEPRYWAQRSFPTAYDADSRFAWRDGWIQVRHAD